MSQKYPCDSPSIVPNWSSLLTSLFTQWKTQRHLPIMAASNSYHSFTPPPRAPPPTRQSVDWERSLPGQQPLYCLSPTEQNSRKKRGRTSRRHHGLDWWKKGRKRRERKEKLQRMTHAGSQYTIDCSRCYFYFTVSCILCLIKKCLCSHFSAVFWLWKLGHLILTKRVSVRSDQVCCTPRRQTAQRVSYRWHVTVLMLVLSITLILLCTKVDPGFYSTRAFIDEEEKLVYLKHQVCMGMNSLICRPIALTCMNSILTQRESRSGDQNDLQVFPLSLKSTCRGRAVH